MIKKNDSEITDNYKFGTFGGVFTPSILTILGVILFMRANFVVGQAGIFGALIILFTAEMISLLTGVSLASISTNTAVGGGGAYFVISRVLGPSLGGAIGVALFLAQAFSVPFYVLGFVESLLTSFPPLIPYGLAIRIGTILTLFGINWIGSQWAVKTQYVVMSLLAIAIVVLLSGAMEHFSVATLRTNWSAAYTSGSFNFWIVFAIYFPAVTGIMSGVNMSGDLKTPSQSIVRGTFAAIFVGAAIYAMQIVLCGGAFSRESLVTQPYQVLVDNALFGAGFLVMTGMFAASLSSAIGSFMGAPRVLQAMAKDKLLRILNPFAAGVGPANEPRRAMLLTLGISIAVILAASSGKAGDNALNIIAAIVSMFFLCTYGMVNLSAFGEAFGGNPSFRPSYRWFHWSLCALGFLMCIGAMLLINIWSAIAAIAVVVFLCIKLKPGQPVRFGDARQGIAYTVMQHNLSQIRRLSTHAKNWRPTILAMTGNPEGRSELPRFAIWMNGGRGVVYLVQIIGGTIEKLGHLRSQTLQRMEADLLKRNLQNVYPLVVVNDNFDQAMRIILQSAVIGPISPNLVLFGWPQKFERLEAFGEHLRNVAVLKKSMACLIQHEGSSRRSNRIDIWWRGKENGSLMLLLAHLIRSNPAWTHTSIRLIRVIEDNEGRTPSLNALRALGLHARIDVDAECIVSNDPIARVIIQHSSDARLVIMGFIPPPTPEATASLFDLHTQLHDHLHDTLLVWSNGDADITA